MRGAPELVLVQGHYIVVDLRGGAIFPHPMEWSIFAATRLSFQVRNGTGRFPCAMPPAKLVVHTLPTHWLLVAAWLLVGGCCWCGNPGLIRYAFGVITFFVCGLLVNLHSDCLQI